MHRLAAIGHFGGRVLAADQVAQASQLHIAAMSASGDVVTACQRLLVLVGFCCLRLARMARLPGTPNPSLKRSAIGRAPGPVCRYTVHGTFSPARARHPAAVARLAQTLGVTNNHRGVVMFGWLKRRTDEVRSARHDLVTYAADESAKFMLVLQAALGGFPRKLFDHPFVIGGAAMYAAITLQVASDGRASNVMVESAMTGAVEKSFSGKGVARHEAIGALMQFKNDPDYAKAVQVVTLIVAAKYERKDLVNDPLISEARARVRSMPDMFRKQFGDTEPEQTAWELTSQLFVAPMKEKYGQVWRKPGDA